MEAGKVVMGGQTKAIDLINAMIAGANPECSDEDTMEMEPWRARPADMLSGCSRPIR